MIVPVLIADGVKATSLRSAEEEPRGKQVGRLPATFVFTFVEEEEEEKEVDGLSGSKDAVRPPNNGPPRKK